MMVRTTKLYGNCKVFSPDNKLMFRCAEKKIKWYLDRNLAVLIENDPLSIRLTFQPKGTGDKIELLKSERKNVCVVCGEQDLSVLTKHHLVPYEYRQHMPNEVKRHSSMFVLPICSQCHKTYEVNFSSKLKEKLALTYNTVKGGERDDALSSVLKKLYCLIKHSNKLPTNIKEEMISFLSKYLSLYKIGDNIDFSDISKLKEILAYLKTSQHKYQCSHGKLVIERCNDLKAFEKMWINDFVTNMNPKYLPDFIKEYMAGLERSVMV